MVVGILLIQAVGFAIISAIVASNKNRNPVGWGALGFLFGLFGFIAAVAVGEIEEKEGRSGSRGRSTPSAAGHFNPDEHEKKCPRCAEYIKLEAQVCKHFEHEFSEEEVVRQVEKAKKDFEDKENGELYCERSEMMVRQNPDGTCPACGHYTYDDYHPSSVG